MDIRNMKEYKYYKCMKINDNKTLEEINSDYLFNIEDKVYYPTPFIDLLFTKDCVYIAGYSGKEFDIKIPVYKAEYIIDLEILTRFKSSDIVLFHDGNKTMQIKFFKMGRSSNYRIYANINTLYGYDDREDTILKNENFIGRIMKEDYNCITIDCDYAVDHNLSDLYVMTFKPTQIHLGNYYKLINDVLRNDKRDDRYTATVEDIMGYKSDIDFIYKSNKILSILTKEEKDLLNLKYNLDGKQDTHTLKSIGVEIGLSPTGARSRINKTLKKLIDHVNYKLYPSKEWSCKIEDGHINALQLSKHVRNALIRGNCNTIGDLIKLIDNNKLANVRCIGEKSIKEIKDKLDKYRDGTI